MGFKLGLPLFTSCSILLLVQLIQVPVTREIHLVCLVTWSFSDLMSWWRLKTVWTTDRWISGYLRHKGHTISFHHIWQNKAIFLLWNGTFYDGHSLFKTGILRGLAPKKRNKALIFNVTVSTLNPPQPGLLKITFIRSSCETADTCWKKHVIPDFSFF